jgi:hypothetical protein
MPQNQATYLPTCLPAYPAYVAAMSGHGWGGGEGLANRAGGQRRNERANHGMAGCLAALAVRRCSWSSWSRPHN